ncbi:PIN domain-containing protein [Actinomycetota bacterium]
MRIVLDTNVFISAAILGRVCEEIVQTCRFSNLEVFISKDIISELKDKLS